MLLSCALLLQMEVLQIEQLLLQTELVNGGKVDFVQ